MSNVRIDLVHHTSTINLTAQNTVLSFGSPVVSIPFTGQTTNGAFRYTTQFEVYNGTQWQPVSLINQYVAAILASRVANGVNNKAQSVGKQYGSLVDLVANGSSSNVTINLSESNNFRINVTNTLNANISISYSPLFNKASILIDRQNTAPWDILKATYKSESFSVTSQESSPGGLFFKSDGTKMFIVGIVNDSVRAYDLSTPWNINTAVYYSNSFNTAINQPEYISSPGALYFKPDGTKFFSTDGTGKVFAYNIPEAWDIKSIPWRTPLYSEVFNVASQQSTPSGLYFKPDGTRMFVAGSSGGALTGKIYAYDLTEAWNVNTAIYYSNSYNTDAQNAYISDLFFKDDGTQMFIINYDNDRVYTYDLSDPWNINSAVYYSNTFSVNTQESLPTALFFKPDGTRMFAAGSISRKVYAYDLSTPWNINTAVYYSNAFSFLSTSGVPGGMTFNSDGTKMYIISGGGAGACDIKTYDLSTPWNINTASYSVGNAFSTVQYDTDPHDVFFKPDGTKMYIVGSTSTSVYQYNLATPWNVNTTSNFPEGRVYLNFANTIPRSVFFKPDGSQIFIMDNISDTVKRYNLSEPWNVSSTIINDDRCNMSVVDGVPEGLFFKDDGTQMFVVGTQFDNIIKYDLSDPWNVNSAIYYSNLFSVNSQEVAPQSLHFKPDGTKMFVVGIGSSAVRAYDLLLSPAPQINFAANVQYPNNYVLSTNTYKRNTSTLYYEILNVMGGSRYQVITD
jgi:hypothetical protein